MRRLNMAPQFELLSVPYIGGHGNFGFLAHFYRGSLGERGRAVNEFHQLTGLYIKSNQVTRPKYNLGLPMPKTLSIRECRLQKLARMRELQLRPFPGGTI